jgi:hypothetical protein
VDKAAVKAKIALREAEKKHNELSLERDQIFAVLVKRMRKTI